MTRRGLLLIVSAPSGTGKTTLVEKVTERVPDIVRSRSYTSRAPRPGEANGVDYNFVKEAQFSQMVETDAFLEWADVFGHLYGTSAADTERHRAAGRDVVLVIDVQGARQVQARSVNAVSIFVLPPSFEVLEARLRQRSQAHTPEEELQRRLWSACREVEARKYYDYVVVNDEINSCVDRVSSIVIAERSTATAMQDASNAIVVTFLPDVTPRSE